MQTRPLSSPQRGESELIAEAIHKDEGAVREIIRRHNQRLYRLARGILRDDHEAEDALQEAYLRAFSQLANFRGEAAFGTWLGRIVLNEALGRQRRRRTSVALTENPQIIPFPHASQSIDPERSLAQHEIRKLLERAIDQLPDDFRVVLIARAVEGMSTKETAALLDLNAKTVKTSTPPCSRAGETGSQRADRLGPERSLSVCGAALCGPGRQGGRPPQI